MFQRFFVCVASHFHDPIYDYAKENVSIGKQWRAILYRKSDQIQKNKRQLLTIFHNLSEINLLHVLAVLDMYA